MKKQIRGKSFSVGDFQLSIFMFSVSSLQSERKTTWLGRQDSYESGSNGDTQNMKYSHLYANSHSEMLNIEQSGNKHQVHFMDIKRSFFGT